MAKILDSQLITQPTYKIIELKKGFLINGQYYLKENMQPVPFNTVIYNNSNPAYFTDSSRSLMSLARMVKYFGNGNTIFNGATNNSMQSLCFDSKDETITYLLLEANMYKFICKFKEENNKCKLLNVVFIDSNVNSKAISIYEKDDEILCSVGGPATSSTIYRYSKENLTAISPNYIIDGLSSSSGYQYDQYCEIYKDDSGYFAYKSGYGSNTYAFYNFSQGKNTTISMNDVDPCFGNTANNRNRFNYNNLYKKTDNTMSVIHLAVDKLTDGKVNFKAGYIVEYNKNEKTLTKSEAIPIQVNPEVSAKYSDGTYLVSENWSSDVWYKKIGGKQYTILYLRDSYLTSKTSRAYFFEHKIGEHSKEILYLDKVQEFPLGQAGIIIHYNDEENLKFYGSKKVDDTASSLFSNVYCYELDESRLEFVKTFSIDGEIKEFGFDIDRNLYVLWKNDEVSRYNERTVSTFNADFEEGLYEYQGEDILTNLIISTTNLDGKFIAKTATLDMRGNAKFTSTGTKTITLTTSASEATKVPITITGAGALSIFPKIKM